MRHLVLLAMWALLTLSCAAPSSAPPSSIAPLDRTRVLAVESHLKNDEALARAGIQVSASASVITLTGNVPSEEARRKAEELALKVRGVTKVDNQLQVLPSP